jgi:eukaryotic-like serine/threonine-protein kinase
VGIVHRDLKPANICIAADGVVKVIDFGLARLAPPLAEVVTRSASIDDLAIVGTCPYMSPEQTRGHLVDGRTDIWAFGCILYQLLTGKLAFPGPTWTETFVAIAEKDPDWSAIPGDVPRDVTALIRHCLVKDVRGRLRDIADARIYFERDLAPAPAAAPVGDGWWRTLLPWAIAGGLAAVLAGVAWTGRVAAPERGPEYARATRLTTGPSVALGPVISPDGQWVTYIANSGGQTDLMVRYVNGGEAVSLTRGAGLQLPVRTDIGGPAISPDGSLIAFDAGAKPGTPANLFDSWVIPAPLGGIPRKMVERGRSLRWSPDGTHIVYVRAGAAAGDAIYVANADGSDERIVV